MVFESSMTITLRPSSPSDLPDSFTHYPSEDADGAL
jgi:hypothetical protein